MKARRFSKDVVEQPMSRVQDGDARRARMWPEYHQFTAGLQDPSKLLEHSYQLIALEMFDNPQVIDAVEAGAGKWKVQNAAMTNRSSRRVVALVNPQCRGRNVERRDAHSRLKPHIHLAASAAGVK